MLGGGGMNANWLTPMLAKLLQTKTRSVQQWQLSLPLRANLGMLLNIRLTRQPLIKPSHQTISDLKITETTNIAMAYLAESRPHRDRRPSATGHPLR